MRKLDDVIKIFAAWRVFIFVAVALSPLVFALQKHHLGGGLSAYLLNPVFWSSANFDGEHYISIATYGYKPLQHFFFPVYPLLISALNAFDSPFSYVLFGQVISNTALFVAIIGLYKVLRFDYSQKISLRVVIALLLFPTSFYYATVYTESIFLALVAWSLFFARKQKWLFAAILAGILSATRIIGVVLVPVFILEWWYQGARNRKFRDLLLISIGVSGLAAYMLYLHVTTGNGFIFKTGLEAVYGEQRSDGLILLPQVFYRYIFKILPSMNWNYFEGAFSLGLEFFSGTLFFILSIVGYFKLRKSYWLYLTLGYLIPTFSGSFSSIARYVLVLFPGFILIAQYLTKIPKAYQVLVIVISTVCLFIATALFSRGYWVA